MDTDDIALYRPAIDTGHTGSPMLERYAEVTAIDVESITVYWNGAGPHTFSRSSGKCIESTNGVMRGFLISPGQEDRLRALTEPTSPVNATPAPSPTPPRKKRT